MHSPPNLEAKYKGINKKVPWKIIIYNHNYNQYNYNKS